MTEKARASALLKKYNLTVAQWDAMFARQGGVCAICKRHQRYRRLCVDHCHKTGRVRGLLCNRCNRNIARFYDSPILLRSAADYLERSRENT